MQPRHITDNRLWAGRLFVGFVAGFAALCLVASPAAADETSTGGGNSVSGDQDQRPQPPEEFAAKLQAANDAYNNNKYEAALAAYTDAAQLSPTDPFPYVGIARAYFWMDRYAAAVFHYDLFLKVASRRNDTRQKVDNQLKAARSERRLASSRSDGDAWQRPEAQRRLVSALRDELDEGAAYTAGGGGAWALYKALIRTNYVEPDLERLRRRLARKLVGEVDERLTPSSGALVPTRALEDWKEDDKRLEAAASLYVTGGLQERIDTRRKVVTAGIDMLNGNHADAATAFEQALGSLEDWTFLRWLRIACLIRSSQYKQANQAIASARNRPFITSNIQAYLTLMEGVIAQRQGRDDEAARIFRDLMSQGDDVSGMSS
jgi:tetratricopeptide (TPR) repeat protein